MSSVHFNNVDLINCFKKFKRQKDVEDNTTKLHCIDILFLAWVLVL